MTLDTDGLDLYIEEMERHKRVLNALEAAQKWGIPDRCWGMEDGHCDAPAQWRRQNTAYVEDRSNWVFMCDECSEVNNAYWQERWDEYYSSRL